MSPPRSFLVHPHAACPSLLRPIFRGRPANKDQLRAAKKLTDCRRYLLRTIKSNPYLGNCLFAANMAPLQADCHAGVFTTSLARSATSNYHFSFPRPQDAVACVRSPRTLPTVSRGRGVAPPRHVACQRHEYRLATAGRADVLPAPQRSKDAQDATNDRWTNLKRAGKNLHHWRTPRSHRTKPVCIRVYRRRQPSASRNGSLSQGRRTSSRFLRGRSSVKV